MSCKRFEDLLPGLAAGFLRPDEEAPLRDHLAGCLGCADAFGALSLVHRTLASSPPPPPDPRFVQGVLRRLPLPRGPLPARSARWDLYDWAVAGGTVIAATLSILFLFPSFLERVSEFGGTSAPIPELAGPTVWALACVLVAWGFWQIATAFESLGGFPLGRKSP